MMPVNTAAMNAVPRHLFGKATALSTTVRSIMQALAITFMTTIITNMSNYNFARLSEQITPFNLTSNYILKVLQGIYLKYGLPQGNAQSSALSTIGKMLYAQAYLDAINYAIVLTVPAIFLSIILVLMMSSKEKTKKKELEDIRLSRKEVSYESEAGIPGFVE
jgi:hypothetical protein